MNLTTPREPLLQQLQFVTTVAPTRSPRAILCDVLISVEGKTVELTATDGEIHVRRQYTHDDVSGSGTAAIPAQTLLQSVRLIGDEMLTIEQVDQTHEIRSDRTFYKINGDDPEMFPLIPMVEDSEAIEISLAAFSDLCQRTMFAAAKDLGRYAFNGVLVEIDPESVTLVATDGRRLALAEMAGPTGISERRSAVVPQKGLLQLQRMVADEDAMLRIELTRSLAVFRMPDAMVMAQLVEGEFPDFRAVVPKEEDVPVSVALRRGELAAAIDRAAIMTSSEAPTLRLSFSEGQLTIEAKQEGKGETRSDMAVTYDGTPFEIRFNPTYLGEYLKTTPEDEVSFRFKDRASAGMFTASTNSRYVVMPITS